MIRKSLKSPEELRGQIDEALARAGLDLDPTTAKEIEGQMLALFREYSRAPENARDAVYASGEALILETLRQANHK